jgi:hypothetical protein
MDGVAQVVEHLASKWEALSSNPTTAKRKRLFKIKFSSLQTVLARLFGVLFSRKLL